MRTYAYIYEIVILLSGLALLTLIWALWRVWWHTSPPAPHIWIAKPDEIEVDLVRDTEEDLRVKLTRWRHEIHESSRGEF